jgi:hypothetical protein
MRVAKRRAKLLASAAAVCGVAVKVLDAVVGLYNLTHSLEAPGFNP